MNTPTRDLSRLVLRDGGHTTPDDGMCAMEAIAWLAGEPHSDHPACACPVVTRYVQGLNDGPWSSDAARTEALLPWLLACDPSEAPRPCILGSRSTSAVERARAKWLAHRAMTWWAPLTGMATVMTVEANGYDCTEMRTAYLALLECPSHLTAELAADAANTAVVYAYTDRAALAALAARDALSAPVGEAADNAARACTLAARASHGCLDTVLRAAVADLGALLSITEEPLQ